MEGRARDEGLAVAAEVAPEGVVEGLGVTGLEQRVRQMRTPDHSGTGRGHHFVRIHRGAELAQPLHDRHGPPHALGAESHQPLPQRLVGRIQEVAEQVELEAPERRGELDPRDELDRIPRRLARGAERLDRVMVGDGEGRELALQRQCHQGLGRERPVAEVGVRVKVGAATARGRGRPVHQPISTVFRSPRILIATSG